MFLLNFDNYWFDNKLKNMKFWPQIEPILVLLKSEWSDHL